MTDPHALLEGCDDTVDIQTAHGLIAISPSRVAPQAFAALRAVLDLHDHDTVSVAGTERRVCSECSDPEHGCWTMWPCETVLAITTALEAK